MEATFICKIILGKNYNLRRYRVEWIDDEGNLKIKRGFKKSELAHLWIEKMHLKIDSFPMVFYEGEGENDD